MAKRKSTTDRPSFAEAKEAICSLEDDACQEVFGLEHLAGLLELFGEHIGSPGRPLDDMEAQHAGSRIEYMGGLVKRHAKAIMEALSEIRRNAEQMRSAPRPGPTPAVDSAAQPEGGAA